MFLRLAYTTNICLCTLFHSLEGSQPYTVNSSTNILLAREGERRILVSGPIDLRPLNHLCYLHLPDIPHTISRRDSSGAYRLTAELLPFHLLGYVILVPKAPA